MESKRLIQIGEYERNVLLTGPYRPANNILDGNFLFDSIKNENKIVNWGTVPHFLVLYYHGDDNNLATALMRHFIVFIG